MLMGYMQIVCPECERKLQHHMRDLQFRKKRVCPDCGTLIHLEERASVPSSDPPN